MMSPARHVGSSRFGRAARSSASAKRRSRSAPSERAKPHRNLSATGGFAAEAVSDLGPQDAYLTVELERGFAGMRRSSPLLDRRNERGQPRATVLVEIDSEGVLVQRARSRAAIAQEALELPALPAVLDPDQQLPHVAPVPSLLLLIHVHARSLELCRHALVVLVPGSARKSPLRMFSSVIANDDRLHDPVVPRIGLFGSRRWWVSWFAHATGP
jgi:hypothetical protein